MPCPTPAAKLLILRASMASKTRVLPPTRFRPKGSGCGLNCRLSRKGLGPLSNGTLLRPVPWDSGRSPSIWGTATSGAVAGCCLRCRFRRSRPSHGQAEGLSVTEAVLTASRRNRRRSHPVYSHGTRDRDTLVPKDRGCRVLGDGESSSASLAARSYMLAYRAGRPRRPHRRCR